LAPASDQRQQRFAGSVVKDGFVEHAFAIDRGQASQHGVGRLLPERVGCFAEKQSQRDQVGIAFPFTVLDLNPNQGAYPLVEDGPIFNAGSGNRA
jgi:hypothetical protein